MIKYVRKESPCKWDTRLRKTVYHVSYHRKWRPLIEGFGRHMNSIILMIEFHDQMRLLCAMQQKLQSYGSASYRSFMEIRFLIVQRWWSRGLYAFLIFGRVALTQVACEIRLKTDARSWLDVDHILVRISRVIPHFYWLMCCALDEQSLDKRRPGVHLINNTFSLDCWYVGQGECGFQQWRLQGCHRVLLSRNRTRRKQSFPLQQ